MITYNQNTSSAQWQYDGENNNFSWSHTVSSNSNRILVVLVLNTGGEITGIKYNDVSMTLLSSVAFDTPTSTGSLYYLINPDSGAHNVEVFTGSFMPYEGGAMATAVDYYGVDQTNPINDSVVGEMQETDVYELTCQPDVYDTRGISFVISNSGWIPTLYENTFSTPETPSGIYLFSADIIYEEPYDKIFEWYQGDNTPYPIQGALLALKPAAEATSTDGLLKMFP